MPSSDRARAAGASALGALRRTLATKAADLLANDPKLVASAVEVGLVDRAWLEAPGEHPISTATPIEVIQRFLERSVEQEPTMVARLGLDAIQMLSWHQDDRSEGGLAQPVTVVFTDLEGFTAFTAREGDATALTVLSQHHRLVGPVIRSRGGRIVKRLGDGLLLSFGAPEAAVLAGLELQELPTEALRLRVGMHTGEAVTTPDDLIGHVVNVAARVTEVAKGGEVLVTAEVRDAVRPLPGVEFGRVRRRDFKGVAERVGVCRAARAGR